MRIHTLTQPGGLLMLLATGLILASPSAAAAEPTAGPNLVQNGQFEQGTEYWTGVLVWRNGGSETVDRPDFVQHETEDLPPLDEDADENAQTPADDDEQPPRGALRFAQEMDGDISERRALAHQSGVSSELTDEVPEDAVARVRFQAKHVSGSPYLSIQRQNGGGTPRQVIELTDEWTEHEVLIDMDYATRWLTWSLVREGDRHRAHPRLAPGECLITDVRVRVLDYSDL